MICFRLSRWLTLSCLLALAACVSPPTKKPTSTQAPPANAPPTEPAPTSKPTPITPIKPARPAPAEPTAKPAAPSEPINPNQSSAKDLTSYRKDAAHHLYKIHSHKIYRGKLPSMLMAVGVVNVVIGPQGQIQELIWSRAPDHVPEVKREIETLIRQAGPFPAPVNLRTVVYTETWLWHKSGKFQLDTLTEGQQ